MKLDILAIAAHPDDAELGCSGTLYKHKTLGKKVGICDLTQGELGSLGTPEIRKKEAAKAAQILELDAREMLDLGDGFLTNSKENKLEIIKIIRKYQPDIVLCNAPKDRHPDHGNAAKLTTEACFLSGLRKIDTGQDFWRPKKIFHYIQDYHLEPDFIIDISGESYLKKMESIQAFDTQFLSNPEIDIETYISTRDFMKITKQRAEILGRRIGCEQGEGFLLGTNYLGLNSFQDIILPKLT